MKASSIRTAMWCMAFLMGLMVSPTFGQAAEPLKIYAAGSLVEPLKEVIAASGLTADGVAAPTFGPAGLLEQRLEKGEAADLYLSADVAHPERLKALGKAAFVIPFARNRLCLLSREALGLTEQNALDKMLDPKVRLATSTPSADPGGDYAITIFNRAEKLHPGAEKILAGKAMTLIGSPNAMAPIAGKSPIESIFIGDHADAMLYYCSGQEQTLRDVPGLVLHHLPPELDIEAVYGMAVLSDRPDAQRLALFLVSGAGQAIMAKHGMMAVLGVK